MVYFAGIIDFVNGFAMTSVARSDSELRKIFSDVRAEATLANSKWIGSRQKSLSRFDSATRLRTKFNGKAMYDNGREQISSDI